jgi:hypothetical protein
MSEVPSACDKKKVSWMMIRQRIAGKMWTIWAGDLAKWSERRVAARQRSRFDPRSSAGTASTHLDVYPQHVSILGMDIGDEYVRYTKALISICRSCILLSLSCNMIMQSFGNAPVPLPEWYPIASNEDSQTLVS